ncbi:MAG: Fic family protein, partial [Deltaproteobacteria bacterium]|nr:Fic family protein [Deltaproteobacteria bacterium]
GEIKILGAKIKPPSPYTLPDWMSFYVSYVKENFRKPDSVEALEHFLNFLAKQHTLFESIHPFEDGNGRTGRIIVNYLLLSAGLPLVIIKAKERRDAYIKGLERAEEPLRELMHIQTFEVEKVSKAMESMKASQLIELFKEALRESLDRILTTMLEAKGYKLSPSEEVAKELGYSA